MWVLLASEVTSVSINSCKLRCDAEPERLCRAQYQGAAWSVFWLNMAKEHR
ncbi:hypothetical protein NYE80_15665 [Paenibacillus sp. FSL H7-0357]|uniref:hypothetical protein n=1 Tax=Paenibacillus sp. FSL H7-0357 TaxID=1536774 RepID=UPI000AC279B9|nr:hypothetical protein [Paenibacillus sp. FSL H7-0357]